VHALILIALAAQTEPPPAGFVRPDPSTLRKVIGVRYTRDLEGFEFFETNQEESTIPLISEDNVRAFVATRKGVLLALDVQTGEQLWRRDDMGAVGRSMIEYQQKVVLGSDSAVVALDQQIGKERWRIDVDAPIGGKIARTSSIAVIPLRPNMFVGVDLEKGERLWRVKRPTPEGITVRGQAQPTIDRSKRRAYLGFSDGALAAVDLYTGATLWTAVIGNASDFFADIDTPPVIVDEGKAVIGAAYNTGLFKLDASSGAVIWKQPNLRISGMTTAGAGLMVAVTGDRQVLGIYTENGKIRWRYKFRAGAPVDPVFIGRNQVVVGSTGGPMVVLDVDMGKPLQILSPGSSGMSVPPAWDDPDMVLLSNKGTLMVMRYGSGSNAAPAWMSDEPKERTLVIK
jgi:outer membrane protein assembly factor BamB